MTFVAENFQPTATAKMFKAVIILLLLGLTQALASRPMAGEEEFVVLSTQKTTNGTLIFYGEASRQDSTMVHPAAISAGGTIECSDRHQASILSCRSLITTLSSDGGALLSESPRSVCLEESGDNCCVSWSHPITGLKKSDLVGSANRVIEQCLRGATFISGMEKDVNLHAVFITQCLSNRPTGCN